MRIQTVLLLTAATGLVGSSTSPAHLHHHRAPAALPGRELRGTAIPPTPTTAGTRTTSATVDRRDDGGDGGDEDDDRACLSSFEELSRTVPTPPLHAAELLPAVSAFLAGRGAGDGEGAGAPAEYDPTIYCAVVTELPLALRHDYNAWNFEMESWCGAHSRDIRGLLALCGAAGDGDGDGDGDGGGQGEGEGEGEGEGGGETEGDASDDICAPMVSYVAGGCVGDPPPVTLGPHTRVSAAETTAPPLP